MHLNRAALGLGLFVTFSMALAGEIPPPALAVNPAAFRVTVFADGVSFPTSMQQVAPGYILAATTANPSNQAGAGFYGRSIGQLLLLHDADGDGVAETRKVVADNLPATLCSVRQAGRLILAVNQGADSRIHFFGQAPAPPTPTRHWEV